ncbi:hypothetical protein PEL8287_02522 [Roseovarius litorisediminis]|uniref:Uncharacterized protein n=1 Tax=Roseovarius litorisediminis TaxID=1312363 RepID=A0A1Y5SV95_9RHOB|nr:hypothetical protein [Roseovarius litorisediminis]SLN48618.1 hypothetical protein PEL8287_02522 [Roseovarius litorisediminis]
MTLLDIPVAKTTNTFPVCGDTIFVWHQEDGLLREALVNVVTEREDYLAVEIQHWLEYPDPKLPRSHLASVKGLSKPHPDDMRDFLGARRRYYNLPMNECYLAELDIARRSPTINSDFEYAP